MYQIYCVKNYELVCQTYIIFKVVQSMSKTRIRFFKNRSIFEGLCN